MSGGLIPNNYSFKNLPDYGPCHSSYYDHAFFEVTRNDGKEFDLDNTDRQPLGLDRCWTELKKVSEDKKTIIIEKIYQIGE